VLEAVIILLFANASQSNIFSYKDYKRKYEFASKGLQGWWSVICQKKNMHLRPLWGLILVIKNKTGLPSKKN